MTNQINLVDLILEACQTRDIKKVKFLLLEDELQNKNEINIKAVDSRGLNARDILITSWDVEKDLVNLSWCLDRYIRREAYTKFNELIRLLDNYKVEPCTKKWFYAVEEREFYYKDEDFNSISLNTLNM